jgi:hypothetical protein
MHLPIPTLTYKYFKQDKKLNSSLKLKHGVYFIFSLHIKNHHFIISRFRQDACLYGIVAGSYDEQTKLEKKSSKGRKNEMHPKHEKSNSWE